MMTKKEHLPAKGWCAMMGWELDVEGLSSVVGF
jgi:hypothetical protein